jgi:alanine racemase
MPLFRPTICEIDLSALRHNFRELKKKAEGRQILSLVKANAYGHGSVAVSRVLVSEGVSCLGVASVEEGMELRRAGVGVPILCLGGSLGAGASDLLEYGLTPVVFNEEGIRFLQQSHPGNDRPLEVHLKVDTGMGRLGILPEDLEGVLSLLHGSPALKLQGVMTHLARADESEEGPTEEQRKVFLGMEKKVRGAGFQVPIFHLANSAALIDGKLDETSLVRPGIALYGAYPHPRFQDKIDLRPVMTWKSEIISLKDVPVGTPVSYGGTFVTRRRSRIAVMPVGYADGYSRLFSNRGEVLVRGVRVPVAGRVCMDLTMLDVTDLPEVGLGDEVVLIGSQGQSSIRAEELADKIGTISYEIFCAVSSRVPRIAVSGGEGA